MSSTAATVDVGLITVVVNSERTTSHTRTPYFPPFLPKGFVCSPENHALPRTSLKAVGNESRFLAVLDALSCRLQDLSLSEPPARQATAPVEGSVSIETTPADSTAVNTSPRRRFSNCRSRIFSKCTQSIRASFKRMALKAGEKVKKAKGASSRPLFQCPSQAHPATGQISEPVAGRSMLEAPEASQHPQVSRFPEPFTYDARVPTTQGAIADISPPPIYFSVPPSIPLNTLPAVATTGLTGIPMEAVQQPSSLHPTSPAPIPMEVEAGLPSSNATLVLEPRQTSFEPPMDRALDAPVVGSSDTVMSDAEEDVSRATEVIQQTEATSRTLVDPVSTRCLSSAPSNQDVDMEDADDSRSFISLQQASTPLPPAVRNKEAEVKAFFAQLKTSRRPVKSQPTPTPLPSSSEPRKTKGSAARSLMDDIMAGFRSATTGESSQQQVAMAVDPPTQPRPVATTTIHTSPAILPKLPRRTTPVVAGRQPGPQPTTPRHVGTGQEATAPGGSMIPPSEAPSTTGIPTIGKVNGPPARNQVQVGLTSGAAPSGAASDAAMDGVESGRRAVKGSRRAARAIATTGWTLETARQKTREAQIAQDVEHNMEVAPPPASSLKAFEERAKSSAWHAAQPPPPPEAMAYIGAGRKFRRAA